MMKWIARVILFLIIPVFVWVTFSYLGGVITLAEVLQRIAALLVAAVLMFFIAR
jgi:hypothetical protein